MLYTQMAVLGTLLHFLYALRVENWMKNQKTLSTCWACFIFNRKSMWVAGQTLKLQILIA